LSAGRADNIIIGVDAVKIRKLSSDLWAGVNYLLWPAVCVVCGQSISDTQKGLCKNCWDELLGYTAGEYCRRCGADASRYGQLDIGCPDCQGRQLHFDAIARAGVYKGTLQRLVLAFKLSGRCELDLILGFLGDSALDGSGFREKVDVFVPVPMHWTRRLARGYNHSHILAKKLRRGSERISTELVRVRRTKRQVQMASAARRARNVAGAFAVCRGHKFAGRNICLVDDIKTTGATLNECAKVLKQAGAAGVYALVLTVAGQKVP